MAVVQSFTKDRMLQIENTTVIGGFVDVNGNLLLETREGGEINAGNVIGPQGPAIYLLGVAYPWMADGPVPDWSLELNGQAVSRTTYSALFALWGTKYGAGDGSTTFNVPDWRGKTVAGQNNTGVFNAAIGTVVGAETHQLTEAELASHTHAQNSHAHTQASHRHQVAFGQGGAASGSRITYGPSATAVGSDFASMQTVTPTINSTTATNQNTGGDQPHNNVQPTAVVRWIVCAVTGSGAFNKEVEAALTHRVVKASEDAALALEKSKEYSDYSGVDRPSFRVSLSSNQALSGAQQTPKLNFGTVLAVTGGVFNTSNNSYTCPKSGFYLISVEAAVTSAASGPEIFLHINDVLQSGLRAIGYGVAYQTFGFHHPVFLDKGDVIDVRIRNNNGTSFTVDAARTFFSGVYLG